jgi:tellurite resistance protein TehA-like permease
MRARRIRDWPAEGWRTVRELNPGVFAFVMATGIVSSALELDGARLISAALLLIGLAGYVILLLAHILRLARFGARLRADAASDHAFGFLTFAAASDVLAARLSDGGWHWPAAVLLAVGAAAWLVLGYGVPLRLMRGGGVERAGLAGVDGTWFMWAVATQSVAVAAAVAGPPWPAELRVTVAMFCASVGLVLYLLVAALAAARLLLRQVSPDQASPTYWVFMGAAAISVLALSELLNRPSRDLPVPRVALIAVALVLWCFCTWLIPPLLASGVWRHLRHRVPLRHETALWCVSFPIGMYAVATLSLGHADGLAWLVTLGQVVAWIAGVVWVTLFVAMLVQAFGVRRRATRPS